MMIKPKKLTNYKRVARLSRQGVSKFKTSGGGFGLTAFTSLFLL